MAGEYVHKSEINGHVENAVEPLVLPDDWQAQILEIANYPAERDRADRKRRNLEGRLARLGDRYELGDLERSEYVRRGTELRSTIAGLDIPHEPAIIQVGEYLEYLEEPGGSLTRKERCEVLHVVFARVLIDVGERKVTAAKPTRDFEAPFRFDGLEPRQDGPFHFARDR